jgi:hypothetical protein
MKTLVLALSLLAAPALAQGPTETPGVATGLFGQPGAACPQVAPMQTQFPMPGRQPYRRLDQLPQARLMMAVLKSVRGCPVAVVKVGERTVDQPLPAGRGRPTPLDVTPRRR